MGQAQEGKVLGQIQERSSPCANPLPGIRGHLHPYWGNPWSFGQLHMCPCWLMYLPNQWRERMICSIPVWSCTKWHRQGQEATCIWPHCNNCKMLYICCTHIVIVEDLNAMGLTSSESVSEVLGQCPLPTNTKKTLLLVLLQHSCGICTKSHSSGKASCPANDSTCKDCGCKDHW